MEANALVLAPGAGRQFLLDAIHRYLPPDALARHDERLRAPREAVRVEVRRYLRLRPR